ncbi:MAG: methylmalonyl-CoA mutase family protein [Balneolaceae bacterium]
MKNNKNLFSEFSPTSLEEWEAVLEKDLKGKDYRFVLKWESLEGISVLPFYRKEDLESVQHVKENSLSTSDRNWKICEEIFEPDPAKAGEEALHAVEAGATTLKINVSDSSDNKSRTRLQTQHDVDTFFSKLDLNKTEFLFNSEINSRDLMAKVKNHAIKTDININASFQFDPFTFAAANGDLNEGEIDSLIREMSSQPDYKTLFVDGAFYHNCGATIIQEVGIALAIASEYVARTPENNRKKTSNQIFLNLSVGSLYFPEIAKLRAVRLLWTTLMNAYKIENAEPVTIHSTTSTWNKSTADAHNNMLRVTTEAMSAVLSGTDLLIVHPYNQHFEKPDIFSKRIARNVNHILKEEAHFTKVSNPASGTYYVKIMMDQIAKKGWEFFQQIENEGGFLKALESGMIQDEINRSADAKREAVATRKITLTGTNNYPNAENRIPEDLFDKENIDNESTLTPHRAAEPFEKIRLKTQQWNKSSNEELTATLIPIGDKRMRKARASFSQNYLQCAGISVQNHVGFSSIQEAAEELSDDKSQILVLCGSDSDYEELVDPFCKEFKNSNQLLILAGYPKQKIEEYKEAGIDLFIYNGSNMIDTLTEIQQNVFKAKDLK